MSALHPTGFPTPAPIALCDDATVIGTTFYLMELVEGRTFWDGSLPGLQLAERRTYYEAMVDTLAALHRLDQQALGLGRSEERRVGTECVGTVRSRGSRSP